MNKAKRSPFGASLLVVYTTVFVDLLGFGIILPLLPFYAQSFGASGLWVGVLMTAYSAAQFVGAPIVGRLSDLYGRRPILLLALAGSAASLLVAGLAESLAVLIAARTLAGLFGGSIAAAQAYVADATTKEERPKYMGLLGAAIGLGFVFGPAIGAALAQFGFGTAAFVAAGIATLNLLVASVRLKESRQKSSAKASGHRFNFSGLGTAFKNAGIRPLLIATFAVTFAFVGMETTYALLGAARFSLTPRGLGAIFTLIGVIVVMVQGGFIGRLARRFGSRRVAMTGALIMAIGLALLPLGETLELSVAALCVMAIGQALTSPSLVTMLSTCAGVDEQGSVAGLGQSLAAAARGLGPVAAGWLFDRSMGAPYVAGAIACLGVGWLISTKDVARALAGNALGSAFPSSSQEA